MVKQRHAGEVAAPFLTTPLAGGTLASQISLMHAVFSHRQRNTTANTQSHLITNILTT